MSNFDLIKHTLMWTYGQCFLWNQHAKQFDMNSQQFQDFVHRTHNIVYRYISGKQTLDGSCSDFECTISIEAKHVFRVHMTEAV